VAVNATPGIYNFCKTVLANVIANATFSGYIQTATMSVHKSLLNRVTYSVIRAKAETEITFPKDFVLTKSGQRSNCLLPAETVCRCI